MTKFKVGPAKTREGREVVIHTISGESDNPIVGQIRVGQSSTWNACSWYANGAYFASDVGESVKDLVPNVLPLKVTHPHPLQVIDHDTFYVLSGDQSASFHRQFKGKKIRVTFEEIIE